MPYEQDKERLERLDKEWEIKYNDYNFLLDQAHQLAEVLELVDSLNKSALVLMEENKHLRKSLQSACDSLGADIEDYL